MARTTKTMLHNSGESAHPCLVPYVRENAFRFSPLRMMLLVVGLLYTAFIMGFCWGRFPVCPLSGEFLFFYHKGFNDRKIGKREVRGTEPPRR